MKKLYVMFFAAALFSSCLDTLNFDPKNINVNVDIHGNLNTTDITSAVLLLINQSKSVDVTRIEIKQNEETVVIFENEPKRLTKKAKYLTPSEKSYTIDIDFIFYRRGSGTEYEGEGSKQLVIPLPLPREIADIFIYRDISGEVKIGTERDLTFDPNDTGDALDDTMVGQGSSPAVISPENRSRMATFVVVNRTRSQNIDNVRFEMSQSAYTMGAVRVRDKQSIALGQGTWSTTVSYTRDDTVVTLPAVNSIIVPSSDPQSVSEHYLYFYLNNKGQYAITEVWPPGDGSAEDILPPDGGYGRGVIKIVNHSDSLVNNLTITNSVVDPPQSVEYESAVFDPPIPVIRDRIGYLDLVGTADFPIDDDAGYLVEVTVKSGDDTFMVTRETRLKDVIVEIIINPDDIDPNTHPPLGYGRGTLWIINLTDSPVNSLTISSLTGNAELLEINYTEFAPPVPVQYNYARVDVQGIAGFPLEDGEEYLITIAMQKNGSTLSVEKRAIIKDTDAAVVILPDDSDPGVPPNNGNPAPYGRGTLWIINQTNVDATSVTAGSLDAIAVNAGYNQNVRVDVTGTESFPLENGAAYPIQVTMSDGSVVNRQAVIRDAHVMVIITPEDFIVAPQPQDFGRGTVWIINRSNNNATAVTVTQPNNAAWGPLTFASGDFIPSGPAGKNQNARVDVRGTQTHPIAAGEEYLVTVSMDAGPSVQTTAIIKDAVVTIEIPSTPAPLPSDYGRGAIMIVNQTNSSVNQLTITHHISSYGSKTINNPGARVDVIGDAAFSIDNGNYRITVTLANGSVVERQARIKDSVVIITIDNPKVYTAGWYENGSSERGREACYWVDGHRIGLRPLNPIGVNDCEATGIAASADGTIYISGWYRVREYDSGNRGEYVHACYWEIKGTTFRFFDLHPSKAKVQSNFGLSALSDEDYEEYFSQATGIAVTSDGKVHVVGRLSLQGDTDLYFTESSNNFYPYDARACYWIDGAVQTLPTIDSQRNTVYGSTAYAVTADGNDVYIAGWYSDAALGFEEWNGDIYWDSEYETCYAFYWRVGSGGLTRLSFPDDVYDDVNEYHTYYTEKSSAYAITVSGGVVYTAGVVFGNYEYEDDNGWTDTNRQLCYWVNNNAPVILNTLYFDTWNGYYEFYYMAHATGIAVYEGAVYVSGWYSGGNAEQAGYWQNGTLISLPFFNNNETEGKANAVTLSANGNIYIAGHTGSSRIASRWDNGVLKRSSFEIESEAHAIVVAP